jgi:hypothetical protein
VTWWFSPDTPFSFTNKTDRHDIAAILLNTIIPYLLVGELEKKCQTAIIFNNYRLKKIA